MQPVVRTSRMRDIGVGRADAGRGRTMLKRVLTATVVAACAAAATGETIAFDDAWADLTFPGDPATYYQPRYGVTFDGGYIVWGGNSNGDPGNWNLEGTNGPAFLGHNSASSLTGPTINFAGTQEQVTFDVGVPNSFSFTLEVTPVNSGIVGATQSFALAGNGGPDGVWTTIALEGPLDEVRIAFQAGTASGIFYGIDNLNFLPCATTSCVVFDDVYADLGQQGDPATYYQADHGLTISGVYFGVIGGVGNGDPGNWDLNGTKGPACMTGLIGVWGDQATFTFDKVKQGASFDIGNAFASTLEYEITVYLNGAVVSTQTGSNTDDNNGNGTWRTIVVSDRFDQIQFRQISGNNWGIDNLCFATPTGCSIADVTTQGAPAGSSEYGVPDGIVSAADLNFFVNQYVLGCP